MIPPWLLAPFLGRALPWAVAGLLGVSLMVALLAASSARTDLANVKAAHSEALRLQAEGYAQQIEMAKADYTELVEAEAVKVAELTKERNDARNNAAALTADLRAGVGPVRLRRVFTACVPDSGPAPSVGERRGPDAAESAGLVVGAVDDQHAVLEACKARVRSDYAAVNGGR